MPANDPLSRDAIYQTLHTVFGFTAFREGQQQAIESVVNGRSAAAIFPTGSGKSLCYQLAALHLPHLTLVVSPLLALMQDQLEYLASRNIPAASIDSTRSGDDVRAIMQQTRSGQLKILMVSVERLKNERFRQFLQNIPVSLLVVDEAHCISEWGHNFRPDYLKLPGYQQQFNIPQALLLTATATPQVVQDMQAKFAIAPDDIVTTGFYRANLDLAVASVSAADRDSTLFNWLSPRRLEPSIVYVTQQKTAEQLANWLRNNGINAVAYHAGLNNDERDRIQQAFMNDTYKCIVATIAFGMGIDKSNIRSVAHYDLPKSVENYCQEIGRAGRDGQPSSCLVLGSRDNLHVLENFVYGDTPGLTNIRKVLEVIREAGHQWEVLINPLSSQANIRLLPLKTLLVYLEMEGIIKPLYSYFAEYRLQYLVQPAELVERFQGERRQFIEALTRSVRMARSWGSLDIDSFVQSYRGRSDVAPTDRSRVLKALDYLQEKQCIVLESKQMTEVFQVTNNHFVLNELAEYLHQLFSKRESSEIHRIQDMLALFESEECLSTQLAHWFGDNSLDAANGCGHCSACRGTAVAFPPSPLQPPEDQVNLLTLLADFDSALSAQSESGNQTADTDLRTRFLCGIAMPLFTRLKARRMQGFGALSQWPYRKVWERVQQLDS